MSELSIQFFTIVARNYLAQAYVLGTSVLQHHAEARFSIFVMDDVDGTYTSEIEAHGFQALGPHQVEIADYPTFVFKYTVTEASTAVKPFVFQVLFEKGADRVIYLDPDIFCYRRFTELLDALNDSAIVLTPHSMTPVPEGRYPDDFLFLSFGAYNLGFIAVSRGDVAERFLVWWAARLLDWCLDLKESNLFVDQKWMDLVPAYFDDVLIFRSMAYNIAYWNFHERQLRRVDGVLKVFPSGEPVAFIHFSGVDTENLDSITRYSSGSPFDLFGRREKKLFTMSERPDLAGPFQDYIALLEQAGHRRYTPLSYAYARYENGEEISPFERTLFWTLTRRPVVGVVPFTTGPDSFYRLCRASGVPKSAGRSAALASSEGPQSVGMASALIRFGLRLMVRAMGQERYVKVAKYLRLQLLPVYHRFLLKD